MLKSFPGSVDRVEAEVLKALGSGILDARRVAEKLGVGVEEVEKALLLLLAKGMVREELIGGEACSRCPLKPICPYVPSGRKIRAYVLTEKGLEALRRLRASRAL